MNLSAFQKASQTALIIVVMLVALGAAIYGGNQASRYFAKATGSPVVKSTVTQITSSTALVGWEASENVSGVLRYGTQKENLSLSQSDKVEGKSHNIPLTILTTNTQYWYAIDIGSRRCDSIGKCCEIDKGTNKPKDTTCKLLPWSFTTVGITPQKDIVAVLPSATQAPVLTVTKPATSSGTPKVSSPSATPKTSRPVASPTSMLSAFCKKVEAYIGGATASPNWPTIKTYDIDSNGRINSADIIKCQKAGK